MAEAIIKSIEPPNLDDLDPWLKKHVTKPMRGFEDLTHPNGRRFNEREILKATRNQLKSAVVDMRTYLDETNTNRAKAGLPAITLLENDQIATNFLMDSADE